jgi:hypothetical protein
MPSAANGDSMALGAIPAASSASTRVSNGYE